MRASGRIHPDVRRFLLGEALFALGTGIQSLLMNLHWSALGFDAAAIGTLLAMSSATIAVLAVPVGTWAGRLGRRRLLLGGTLAIGAGIVVATLPSWPAALAGQLLSALGWTAILTIEFPVVMQYGRDGGEHVAIFSAVVGVFTLFLGAGTLGAGFLPSWLAPVSAAVGAASPYQLPLWLAGALTALTSAVRMGMRIAETPGPRPGWGALLPDGLIARLAVPAALSGFAFGCVAPFLNLIMARRFAADEAVIGPVLTVGGLAVALGSALAPRLAARWGETRAARTALLGNAALAMALALPCSLPVFAVLHWLRSVAFSAGANVVEGRMFSAVPDERRALYAGWRTVATHAGQAAAGALVGRLIAGNATGWPFALAGVAVAGYALWYAAVVAPRLQQAPARPGAAVVE